MDNFLSVSNGFLCFAEPFCNIIIDLFSVSCSSLSRALQPVLFVLQLLSLILESLYVAVGVKSITGVSFDGRNNVVFDGVCYDLGENGNKEFRKHFDRK